MNLKQALKKKNKLVGQLKTTLNRMMDNNSYLEGHNPSYNSIEMRRAATELSRELAELKTKIQLANAPVLHLIYEMGELKNMITHLNRMNCYAGVEINYRNETPVNRISLIGQVQRDEWVERIEDRIDEINDELDRFNAVTNI
jgi:hypothetical protein